MARCDNLHNVHIMAIYVYTHIHEQLEPSCAHGYLASNDSSREMDRLQADCCFADGVKLPIQISRSAECQSEGRLVAHWSDTCFRVGYSPR